MFVSFFFIFAIFSSLATDSGFLSATKLWNSKFYVPCEYRELPLIFYYLRANCAQKSQIFEVKKHTSSSHRLDFMFSNRELFLIRNEKRRKHAKIHKSATNKFTYYLN